MSTIVYDKGLPKEQLSLVISSKEHGTVHDLFPCVREIRWETQRVGAPSKLVFTLQITDDMAFWEGDKVWFSDQKAVLFCGYIFEKEKTDTEKIKVTCFDQLRYLKARQSYNFSGQSADGIIRKIAADFSLNCGVLDATGYAIPSLVIDNQTCLDTITTALEATLESTGRSYCFYDDNGALRLTAATAMVSPYILGDESFSESYQYVTSINHGVHNYIKLVRPNEEAGNGEVYVAKSQDSINRWGMLQYYERVDKDFNAAEIREMSKRILLKDNRLQRTLYLRCIGISEIRSGQIVKVELEHMGEIAADRYLTAERVVHTWSEKGHYMDLTFSLFREADLAYAISTAEFSEYLDVALKESKSSKSSKSVRSTTKKKKSTTETASDRYRVPFHGTYRISTLFGKVGKTWTCGWHTGVDYVGGNDKTVYPICSGKVISVATKPSYGKCVQILHNDGYVSVYAHLSAIYLKNGQDVTTNTKLGREGATGKAYGSHLHLELHKGSYRYPPSPKINPHVYILSH